MHILHFSEEIGRFTNIQRKLYKSWLEINFWLFQHFVFDWQFSRKLVNNPTNLKLYPTTIKTSQSFGLFCCSYLRNHGVHGYEKYGFLDWTKFQSGRYFFSDFLRVSIISGEFPGRKISCLQVIEHQIIHKTCVLKG